MPDVLAEDQQCSGECLRRQEDERVPPSVGIELSQDLGLIAMELEPLRFPRGDVQRIVRHKRDAGKSPSAHLLDERRVLDDVEDGHPVREQDALDRWGVDLAHDAEAGPLGDLAHEVERLLVLAREDPEALVEGERTAGADVLDRHENSPGEDESAEPRRHS